MKKANVNFEALITAAQNGSNDAMTEILEIYMPLINKHSRINGVINEDIRQEILMQIINNIGKFQFQ